MNDICWHEIMQNSWRKAFRLQCYCLCYFILPLAGLGLGLFVLQLWQELHYIRKAMGAASAYTGSSWLSIATAKEQVAISTSLEEHVSFGSCLLHMSLSVGSFRVWSRGWCIRGFPFPQALWHLGPRSVIHPCLSYSGLLQLFHLILLLLPGTLRFCQPYSDWALLGPGSDQEECSSYKLVGFLVLVLFFWRERFLFLFFQVGWVLDLVHSTAHRLVSLNEDWGQTIGWEYCDPRDSSSVFF